MESADLVLLLFDITQPLQPCEEDLLVSCPKNKTILVWNKCDLNHTVQSDCGIQSIHISIGNVFCNVLPVQLRIAHQRHGGLQEFKHRLWFSLIAWLRFYTSSMQRLLVVGNLNLVTRRRLIPFPCYWSSVPL
jgi:tRNA U34 5-carboxymethylaminomethyl modifying GTPase MnmE/TrmE